MPSCPCAHLPVLRMTPVPQYFLQVFIPPNTSAVLVGAGPLTIQAAWNDVMLRPGPDIFDGNGMLPAIAKIILVMETSSFLTGDVPQVDPLIALHVVIILRIRLPVAHCADEKLVQVGMLPTHDDLQQMVQCGQCDLVRHQNAPPDRGVDARKTDIQLVDTLR